MIREASLAIIMCDIRPEHEIEASKEMNIQIRTKSMLVLPYVGPTLLCLSKVDLSQDAKEINSDAKIKK